MSNAAPCLSCELTAERRSLVAVWPSTQRVYPVNHIWLGVLLAPIALLVEVTERAIPVTIWVATLRHATL